MIIHGFHVVSKLDANSAEGFSTTVTHPDGKQSRGPFETVAEAVNCAHEWHFEDSESKNNSEEPANEPTAAPAPTPPVQSNESPAVPQEPSLSVDSTAEAPKS